MLFSPQLTTNELNIAESASHHGVLDVKGTSEGQLEQFYRFTGEEPEDLHMEWQNLGH